MLSSLNNRIICFPRRGVNIMMLSSIRIKRLSTATTVFGAVRRKHNLPSQQTRSIIRYRTSRRPNSKSRCQKIYQQKRLFSDSETNNGEDLANQLNKLAIDTGGFTQWTQRLSTEQRRNLAELIRQSEMKAATAEATVAIESNIPEPSIRALELVALNTAIPFIGFGFLDNAILILAGDAIDTSLGVMLGISTMCAAAIGNIISDLAGLMLGTAIEDFCATKLNLPVPDLTSAQRQLRPVRFANQFGCAVGITIGCIIGMFPLLLIDSKKVQAKKRERHLTTIFQDVVNEAGSLVGASRTCLYLIVNKETEDGTNNKLGSKKQSSPHPVADGKYLYVKYDDKKKDFEKDERWIPLGRGIVSRAALTGDSWNIADVTIEPDFVPDISYIKSDGQPRNMLCVPIMDSSGRPIAVIQAINKIHHHDDDNNNHDDDGPDDGFTDNDVQILKALASHISVSLQRMYENDGDEAELRLKDTIRMLKDYGLKGISAPEGEVALSGTSASQRRLLFPDD